MKSDEPLETPWTRARKRRSQKQEERIGSISGGSKQPNSGRIWRFKRDAKLFNFLVECRTNERQGADSYRVSRTEFLKIEQEAFQTPPGLLPAVQIDIQELQLILIRLTAFQQLQQRILELEAEIELLKRGRGREHQ